MLRSSLIGRWVMLLKARFVFPVEGPPIENGAVAVDGDCIARIGSAQEVGSAHGVDYGDAVIVPGLVNAHTLLDLTSLAGRVLPRSDFTDWLRCLVELRRAHAATREQVQIAVQAGVNESLRAGVTTVGDIAATPGWAREVLAASPLRAVSFGEVIAIGAWRGRLMSRLEAVCDASHLSPRLRLGIAPHAPYTVEPQALTACSERARTMGAPLCIHLAETSEEELFSREGRGPFADFLRALGVWDDGVRSSGCGPIELADRTGVLGPHTLIAHANYVHDDDIARIARSGASVAYCPRTHHAFGHPPHRFRDMLDAGINVSIATDSRASNPSLSILDELRFVRRMAPDVTPEDLLAMGTLRGARALGLHRDIGSLAAGKYADLTILPLETVRGEVCWESIFDSQRSPRAVYIGGACVYTGSSSFSD